MISIVWHDNVRSLKKKTKIAYAPNLGPSHKDDAAAPETQERYK